MKKIIIIGICLVVFLGVKAQTALPVIKTGSLISAYASIKGADFPVSFKILSLDPVSIAWFVEGYGNGSFDMTVKGVESGAELYLAQPIIGKTTLKDHQTFLIISKAAFKSIQDNNFFTYNNLKFTVAESNEIIKINDQNTDTIRLVMDGGKGEVWVLNSPSFPLLVKTKGLPTDIVIETIK